VGDGVGDDVAAGDGLGVLEGDALGDELGADVGFCEGEAEAGGSAVPGHETLTVAPDGETAVVVTRIPDSGSVNDLPSASGASSKPAVDGVMSSRSDCLRVGLSGATRMLTPFTAAEVVTKLS
jgi:hypothetical protein